LELIDVLECLPACVLCFFFPFAVVSEDRCGQVYTSTAMPENQLAKRVSIAQLRQIDEPLVRQNEV